MPINHFNILLSFVRNSLFNEEFPDVILSDLSNFTEDNWESFFLLAKLHGVYGIISPAFSRIVDIVKIPTRIKLTYYVNVESIEKRYLHHINVLNKFGNIFAKKDIQMCLLKGVGIAKMYPNERLRECGDIDCCFFGNYDKANQILRDNGIIVEEDDLKSSHFNFLEVQFDNHKTFLNVELYGVDPILEEILNIYASRMLSTPHYLEGVSSPVILPSPDFNAIFLLRHALTHYCSGNLNIRHLCDWLLFLNRHYDEVNWKEIYSLLIETKLNIVAESFTLLCIKILNTNMKYDIGGRIIDNDNQELEQMSEKLLYSLEKDIIRFNLPQPTNPIKLIYFKFKKIKNQKNRYDVLHRGAYWKERVWKSLVVHLKNPKIIFK